MSLVADTYVVEFDSKQTLIQRWHTLQHKFATSLRFYIRVGGKRIWSFTFRFRAEPNYIHATRFSHLTRVHPLVVVTKYTNSPGITTLVENICLKR